MNKYKTFLFLFILTPIELVSQVKGYIYDSVDQNPIPFVNIWVQDENIGTTSNKSGYFEFRDSLIGKKLIISSIGYERKAFEIDKNILEIYLSPVVYTIPEISVKPKKKLEQKVGRFKRLQLFRYASPGSPQIFARYFAYSDEYSLTPLISSIRIETLSTCEAIFNLRFLSIGVDGLPGEDILPENHLVKVKEGKRTNIIKDISDRHILFPKQGLFVAVEFLIIEENVYRYKYKRKETGEILQITTYMPMIGTLKSDSEKNGWVYRWGNWYKDLGKHEEEMGNENIGNILAVEITLTN
jgi:hypothetical protein